MGPTFDNLPEGSTVEIFDQNVLDQIDRERPANLFILMRTDMDYSMTPGRKMAQASHAANAAESVVKNAIRNSVVWYHWTRWKKEAENFGTAIVLGAKNDDLNRVRCSLPMNYQQEYVCGVVHDPEYYIQDGEIAHKLAIDTCGWIFGSPDHITVKYVLGELELHP